MKKLYLFILASVTVMCGKAQYTVTSAFAPVVGDILNTWTADTTGINPGPAGTNQIWNYFGVTVPSSVAVTSDTYVAVSAAPHYTAYPSATIAHSSDGINYNMESYGSNVTIYGQVNNTLTIVYGNPETLISLPFAYGMASSDTYSTNYVNGTSTVTAIGTLTSTADGWGTLNMPGGKSYPNTLRIKVQSVSTGTQTPLTFTQTTVSYIHLCSASKSSILSININTTTIKSGVTTNTGYGKSVTVSDAIFAGVKETVPDRGFSMYPNPACDKEVNVYYVNTTGENYTSVIYNTIGQQVRVMKFDGQAVGPYTVKIDLHGLDPGIYYLQLKGTNRESIQKLIIE